MRLVLTGCYSVKVDPLPSQIELLFILSALLARGPIALMALVLSKFLSFLR